MRRRTFLLLQCEHRTGFLPYSLICDEHVKALVAIVADKVIGGHSFILPKQLPAEKDAFIKSPLVKFVHVPSPHSEFNIHHPQPLLIVISGPSGAGKDTVMQRMKERGLPFHFVVTATTRPKRTNEMHGRDYWFVSTEEFARMINEDELIEHAIVYGDYKGIPKQQVREALASGMDVIMRVDVQGAETVRRMAPEALMIFITTNNEEELVHRLETRKTETVASLAIRIATARKELKRVDAFDYVIVNHDFRLDETVDVIRAIISAEHHRVKPRKVTL